MQLINGIGNDYNQVVVVIRNSKELLITLRFLPKLKRWIMDVEYDGNKARQIPISSGIDLLNTNKNIFGFTIVCIDDFGLDPNKQDSFITTSQLNIFELTEYQEFLENNVSSITI